MWELLCACVSPSIAPSSKVPHLCPPWQGCLSAPRYPLSLHLFISPLAQFVLGPGGHLTKTFPPRTLSSGTISSILLQVLESESHWWAGDQDMAPGPIRSRKSGISEGIWSSGPLDTLQEGSKGHAPGIRSSHLVRSEYGGKSVPFPLPVINAERLHRPHEARP